MRKTRKYLQKNLTLRWIFYKIFQVSRVQPLPLAPEAKAQLATIPEIFIN